MRHAEHGLADRSGVTHGLLEHGVEEGDRGLATLETEATLPDVASVQESARRPRTTGEALEHVAGLVGREDSRLAGRSSCSAKKSSSPPDRSST